MRKLRAVDYVRVSHKDLERGISVQIQQDVNARAIAAQGWQHVGTYTDDGLSAFNDQIGARPDLVRLLADAKARAFDAVVIYKWDRLARKQQIFYTLLGDFERLNITAHAATESNDWLARGVSGLMAEQYSRMLSARMKDVRRWEASQGRHIGPVPWGYQRVSGGTLDPTDELRWVAQAFELYATRRYSFATLAEQLAEQGARLPSGKPPTKFMIAELLRNPVYIGQVKCQEKIFPGKHPAAIDRALWDKVQELLADRKDRFRGAKVRVAPMLAGLARCSSCGSAMWYSGTGYYQCAGRLTKSTTCVMGGARADLVEQHLVDSLAVLTQSVELMRAVADQIDHLIAVDEPPAVDEQAIRAKMKRLARLYADGLRSDDEYSRELAELRAQLAAPAPMVALPRLADVLPLLTELPALLREADAVDRRATLQELFEDITLAPHLATHARPRAEYRDLLIGIDQQVSTGQWAGWAYPHHTRTRMAA